MQRRKDCRENRIRTHVLRLTIAHVQKNKFVLRHVRFFACGSVLQTVGANVCQAYDSIHCALAEIR